MASITKRDDHEGPPTYQAKVRKAGFPAQSRTFSTRELAELWAGGRERMLVARQEQRAADIALRRIADTAPPDKLTFGDLLVRYRDQVSPRKRAGVQEAVRIRGLLRQQICLHGVANLSPVEVAAWRDCRLQEVTGSTVNREISLLGHVIEVARTEWGLKLQENPFQLIWHPPMNPSRERRLRPGEEPRIQRACQQANPFLWRAITLAIETGMRMGEIVGLQWSAVNLEACSVNLTKTKTGASRGSALSSRAREVLSVIRAEQITAAAKKRTVASDFVFDGLTAGTLGKTYRRMLKRAEITGLTFHDLRHEAISRMFELGLSTVEVATVSGHQTLQLLKRYAHLQLSDLAKKLG